MEETQNTGSATGLDKSKLILPGAIMFAAILVSGTLLYANGFLSGTIDSPETGAPQFADVSVDDDPMLGNENAPVTIIEFSDFQCLYCRRFWKDTMAQLKSEYIDTGKVRFVYRDYPLTGGHPAALVSALGGECAQDQGKFWEFHDKIFQEQDKQGTGTIAYTVTEVKRWAQEIGLNAAEFNACVDSGKYSSEVEKDLADGSAAGVNGTPTFFINGQRLVGALPFAQFKQVIDRELQK
ncbi:MAG: DsbA family protein [Candidatus Yanofskybacteria bacterium]|nr:DsbA family protein [Candidatus Yanofskybacteria bacterium]